MTMFKSFGVWVFFPLKLKMCEIFQLKVFFHLKMFILLVCFGCKCFTLQVLNEMLQCDVSNGHFILELSIHSMGVVFKIFLS